MANCNAFLNSGSSDNVFFNEGKNFLTALDLNEREGATCFFPFLSPNASLALLRLLTCISNTICQGFVSVLNYIYRFILMKMDQPSQHCRP